MPFEKGHKLSNGRPPGSKNKKTEAWDQLGDYLTNEATQRAKRIMDKAEDKDFMYYMVRLAKFFKPEMKSTEIHGEITTSPKKIGIKKDAESE